VRLSGIVPWFLDCLFRSLITTLTELTRSS